LSPGGSAGGTDDHIVLHDHVARLVECRDRRAADRDAEDEDTVRAGRPDLGNLRICGKQVCDRAAGMDHLPFGDLKVQLPVVGGGREARRDGNRQQDETGQDGKGNALHSGARFL
jgi:hypothetical protein